MKLRIKSDATRITIDIGETASLSELYTKCQLVAPDRAWYLSLNGIDEINADMNELIVNIGLVSGDLVHVVEKNDNADLSSQLLQMGFDKASINTVLNSFGAATLNDAIELLSMLASSGSSSLTPKANETPSIHSITPQAKETPSRHSITPETKETPSNHPTMDVDAKQSQGGSILTPLFLQDGITDQFQMLFGQVKCVNESDYLFLLVHALVTEGGFQVDRDTKNSPDSLDESRHSIPPKNWKNSEMGLYRTKYTHYSSPDMHCFITASIIGKCLLVSGTLDEEESCTHQVKLKISDFIDNSHLSSGHPSSIYLNLVKLSHKVKQGITNAIANDIRTRLGLTNDAVNICSLPLELQLRIVNWLDAVSVCRLSQISRDMCRLCKDESLWRRLFCREFGQNHPNNQTTYRQAFKSMYTQRREDELRRTRELERLRQPPRTPLRPEFDITPDIIPSAPSSMPGIIGGHRDLHPLGGFLPGGAPVNPFQPSHPDLLGGGRGRFPIRGDVRPPGARFDPYGPLPDDDDQFFGGRNPHPDMLHRPRFGQGDGFGGGGGYGFI